MKPLPAERIASAIHLVREYRVMLDADLAALYGVTTKHLNQQVKRNMPRFPEDFAFRLTAEEVDALRSQFVTSNVHRIGATPESPSVIVRVVNDALDRAEQLQ